MTTTATRERTNNSKAPVGKFTVEVACGCNRSYASPTLQTNLRGRFSLNGLSRGHDVGRIMANMPDIPGLRIEINLGRMQFRVYDPLTPSDCAKIDAVRNRADAGPIRTDARTQPVPEKRQDWSKAPDGADRFKTLVGEIVRGLKENDPDGEGFFEVTEGEAPTLDQLNAMPGREFFDGWNSSVTKAKYRDQFTEWLDSLQQGPT